MCTFDSWTAGVDVCNFAWFLLLTYITMLLTIFTYNLSNFEPLTTALLLMHKSDDLRRKLCGASLSRFWIVKLLSAALQLSFNKLALCLHSSIHQNKTKDQIIQEGCRTLNPDRVLEGPPARPYRRVGKEPLLPSTPARSDPMWQCQSCPDTTQSWSRCTQTLRKLVIVRVVDSRINVRYNSSM